jgi:hypothetical protein
MISIIAPQAFAAVNSRVANLRPSVAASQRLTWNLEELYFTK